MSRILCLNSNYIPIKFTTKYHAIGKFYGQVCEFIYINGEKWEGKNWDQWIELSKTDSNFKEDTQFVNGTSCRLAVPKIIRYLNYSKIPKVTLRLSRAAIYKRDNYRCYICGKTFSESKLSIDHVIPISRGGATSWTNCATSCKACNWDKNDHLLTELNIKPKFMPTKPTDVSNMARLKNSITKMEDEWRLFL